MFMSGLITVYNFTVHLYYTWLFMCWVSTDTQKGGTSSNSSENREKSNIKLYQGAQTLEMTVLVAMGRNEGLLTN